MISIKTEVGAALRNDNGPDLEAVEKSMAATVALHLGSAIRQRVQERGDLGTQRFPGWSTSTRPKRVSAKYPDRAPAGTLAKSGARVLQMTNAEYHEANATKRGAYSTTGGMWSGLSAVIRNIWLADLMFRGRSQGQSARVLDAKWQSAGGRSRPIKETNSLKAWTVKYMHGVNVLLPTAEEYEIVGEAGVLAVAGALGRRFQIKWDGTKPPDVDVATIFSRLFQVPALKNAEGV